MITEGEYFVFHELKNQGLSISEIARRSGRSRDTVRKHLQAPAQSPVYPSRETKASLLDPYKPYLQAQVTEFPELSARRLLRQIQAQGYAGAYSTLTRYLRTIRRHQPLPFEVRFETAPGEQGQVDFAQFKAEFDSQPGVQRKLSLFSVVLGCSRWLWGRFCLRQDLPTVLRMHLRMFDAMGGSPREILYDRMRTAVIGADHHGRVIYNRSLQDLLTHYAVRPRACRAYRAQTKGKVERPYSYIRQDFYLARRFWDLNDLNAQFEHWLDQVANVRVHGTTRRIVAEAFAQEQPELQPLPAQRYRAAAAGGAQDQSRRDGLGAGQLLFGAQLCGTKNP